MSLKLKAFGVGLLAVTAMGALVAMSASASSGGHFVSDTAHTSFIGTESGSHRLHWKSVGSEGIIGCNSVSYDGTVTGIAVSQFELTPVYNTCGTTPNHNVTITHNECKYRFTASVGGTNGTIDLACPVGKVIEIHHPNCTITLSPTNNQNRSGIHYTTVTENNKHAFTIDVNVVFQTTYHGGICIFLGTNQQIELSGSLTVWGENTAGERVSITST